MKILNVNISLDSKSGGGTAERTLQLTRQLIKMGHDCRVLILDLNGNDKFIKIDSEKIIRLECLNKRFYIPELSLNKIKNAVSDVDVIHLMNHWTFLNAIIYYYAKLFKKPYVICPAGALSYIGRSKHLKNIYNTIIGKKILRDAEYCIAISRNEIGDIRKYNIDDSRIIHIPNGINDSEYIKNDGSEFRQKFDLSNKKIILFVGRLNKIKGVDLLFNAFCNIYEKISDYQLIIAGPDEGLRVKLEKNAKEKNITDRIKFIGYLDSKYKSSAYHEAEVLAIPSRQEAMSIVLLEAGITGTPVLITNKCGFDEINEINGGRLVDATADSIAQGLIVLLSNEEQLKVMGANLKNHVKSKFLWPNIAKRHLDLFNQVIKA